MVQVADVIRLVKRRGTTSPADDDPPVCYEVIVRDRMAVPLEGVAHLIQLDPFRQALSAANPSIQFQDLYKVTGEAARLT